MSARDIVQRANDAFNAHDVAAIRALTAEDCTFWSVGGVTAQGREPCVAANTMWFDACSDAHVTINQVLGDGDTVAVEGVFEGTHDGTLKTPMGDVPATGRRIHGEYVGITTVRNGLAASQRLYFDRMQLAEQLGLIPAGTGTAS
jgi:predicted ester cyclase